MRTKKTAAELEADEALIDRMLRAHLAADPSLEGDVAILAAYDALKAALLSTDRELRELAKLAVTSLVVKVLGPGRRHGK